MPVYWWKEDIVLGKIKTAAMKLSLSLLLFLPVTVTAQRNTGNPKYDFPDSIIKKIGTGPGHANGKLNDLSIAGFYPESRAYEDSFYSMATPINLTLQNKKILNARDLILKEAAKYRILLINEAHNRPEHRLFTKSLLQDLHGMGYNVFMAEGIKFDNGLHGRNYPVSTDGYYLSEPVYASLLRYANKTGYEVYAYEQGGEKKKNGYWDDSVKLDKYGSIKYISYQPRDSMVLIYDEKGLKYTQLTSVREDAQAENIFNVIKAHPQSKFIIHVGHGHLYESGPMMGAKLRALLKGEDVLTIDQVHVTDRIPVIDTVTHETITHNFPYVLQDSITNRFFNVGLAVDYMVFNKRRQPDSLGRPGLLLEDVEKRTAYTPSVKMLKDCPCLFSAYYQDEYMKEGQQTVAVDVILVKDPAQPIPLLLYKGKYIIIKKSKAGLYTDFKHTIK